MKTTLVVIPTYNEATNIARLIAAINESSDVDILVVDDNSPDGTHEIIEKLQRDLQNLHLIKREGKLGLGTAYIAGFRFAINKGYKYIIEMDADFSHDPKEIPRFLGAIEENDLVIGSRYIIGVNVINWSMSRLLLSYSASKYVHFITGLPIKDPTGGFKCFRREVLEGIGLDGVKSSGYSFQIEINHKAWKRGFRIKEIPIVFTDRYMGKTKMTKKIMWEAIWIVWKLRLRLI
jgi:dolichol-phosphate mannosyltransferase